MGSGDSTTIHEGAETSEYRTVHDWAVDGEVSTTVVEAVAAATDTVPSRLPTLYEAVDPDALDALVASLYERGRGTVRFDLAGCQVTVDATGTVVVRRPG